ncbi:MAG: hypothetical protein RR389_08375, partial [Christensenella sp.]
MGVTDTDVPSPTDADAPPRKNPPIPTESDTPAAVMEYVPKPWGKDAPPKPDSENENHGIIGYDQAHGDTSNEIYNEKVLKSERSAIGSIGKAFNIPASLLKSEILPIVSRITEDAIRNGYINGNDLILLYETAYRNGGVSTMENYNARSGLRTELRSTRIYVSPDVRADFADYEEFRQSTWGKLRLSTKDGSSVDVVYAELAERYPDMFDKDIINPADQLRMIAGVYKKISVKNIAFDEYFDSEQKTEFENENIKALATVMREHVDNVVGAEMKVDKAASKIEVFH